MTPQLLSGQTSRIYVVQTYAIGRVDQRGIHSYEIQIAPDPDATAPRVALVTTDPRIYNCALVAEDKPHCFDVTWHRITSAFGVQYEIDQFERRR